MIKYIVVYYIYWICLVIFDLKKNNNKNFMIEFLNVVIDVYVIFFYFKYYMFFKKWILDCSFYFLGVLGRFV